MPNAFDDIPSAEVQNAFADLPVVAGDVDKTSGAPYSVRSAVSGSSKPTDKLATLREFYPDARMADDGNFIFTDPTTKQQTQFNPEGLDVGDIVEFGRGAAEFVGGAIGGGAAIVAGQAGPQVAVPEEIFTVPAAVGAGATAAGEAYDLFAKSIFPIHDTRNALETLTSGGATFVLNAAGQKLGEEL